MSTRYSVGARLKLDGRMQPSLATIRGMGRYTFSAFVKANAPRYVVVWDLQWRILQCDRLEPAADLSVAMEATIERLSAEGWQAEATPEYGIVFVRHENDRRLLMLTPRDPYSTTLQSFNPFRTSNV